MFFSIISHFSIIEEVVKSGFLWRAHLRKHTFLLCVLHLLVFIISAPAFAIDSRDMGEFITTEII